jgi:hypothetical protein
MICVSSSNSMADSTVIPLKQMPMQSGQNIFNHAATVF